MLEHIPKTLFIAEFLFIERCSYETAVVDLSALFIDIDSFHDVFDFFFGIANTDLNQCTS